MYDQDFSAA